MDTLDEIHSLFEEAFKNLDLLRKLETSWPESSTLMNKDCPFLFDLSVRTDGFLLTENRIIPHKAST